MKTGNREQSAKVMGYKVILILLISAAALSNAMTDLNHLQKLADNVSRVGSELINAGVTRVSAKSLPVVDGSCKNASSADDLVRNMRMIPQAFEIDSDISLNLPSAARVEFKPVTLRRDRPSEFPRRTMSRIVVQKRVRRAIENAERELVLKTFNGSISLRAVS